MKYLTALFVFLALLLFDVVMIAGFVGAGKLTLAWASGRQCHPSYGR